MLHHPGRGAGAWPWSTDAIVTVCPPVLQVVDHRGAGDSMTAGLAAGLAKGLDMLDALRLGAAAAGAQRHPAGPGHRRPAGDRAAGRAHRARARETETRSHA